jgi:hypothetical protein
MDFDWLEFALGAGGAGIAIWFYPHCARPSLALAGARRPAFIVALAGTIASAFGFALAVVGSLVLLPEMLYRLGADLGLLFFVSAAAFLAPGLFIRLTGGRDATAPVRFILTWFRGHWRELDEDDERRAPLIDTTLHEIEARREAANETLVAAWSDELNAFLSARQQGPTSTRRHRERIDAKLASLQPVDPLAQWY